MPTHDLPAPILEARDLIFDYPGPLRALDGVDFTLAPGELVVAIGPNGSGKSTLQKVLAGLLAPTAGEVRLDGRPLASFAPRERAQKIAVVPQFLPRLFDVRVGEFVHSGRYARIGRWQSAAREDRAAVARALEECDAADLAQRSLAELSGGQRQRVLVARAIAQDARILLIDEPSNALDPEHQIRVFELIASFRSQDRASLVVTHDLNLASQFATRIVLLDRGRIVARGSVEDVLRREVLEPVYGEHLYYGRFSVEDGGHARSGRPFVLPSRSI